MADKEFRHSREQKAQAESIDLLASPHNGHLCLVLGITRNTGLRGCIQAPPGWRILTVCASLGIPTRTLGRVGHIPRCAAQVNRQIPEELNLHAELRSLSSLRTKESLDLSWAVPPSPHRHFGGGGDFPLQKVTKKKTSQWHTN